jgi:hypothetical protein
MSKLRLSPPVKVRLLEGQVRAKPEVIKPVRPGNRMRTWKCPKCHLKVTCVGQVVGHVCPANGSKFTRKWEEVK